MFLPTHSNSDRLRVWRQYRNDFPSDGTVKDVLKTFSQIKILPRYLDYYNCKDWPNVFEIVAEGYFCQSGISYILAHTLKELGFINQDNLIFRGISNHINGVDGAVFFHEGKCYNFVAEQLVDEQYALDNCTVFSKYNIALDN